MSKTLLAEGLIRDIPDFPIPGIVFKDITPALGSAQAFQEIIDELNEYGAEIAPDLIVGVESRGFIFAAPLALALGVGFVPIRKPGKLPYETVREEYALEYGTTAIEIHKDAIQPGQRVLVVDDVLATGGTALAAAHLVEAVGGTVASFAFVIELTFLNGCSRMAGYKSFFADHLLRQLLARSWFPGALLAAGVVCVSTAGLIAHRALAEATPLAVAAWRLGLASLFLASLNLRVWKGRSKAAVLLPAEWVRLLLAGVALALHFLLWFASLALTSVSIATLLACTTPLWNALIGLISGKAKEIRRLFWAGLAAALFGITLVMSPGTQVKHGSVAGDCAAVGAGLAFALYLVFIDGLQHHASLRIVSVTYTSAAVVLWAALLLTRGGGAHYSAPVWEALVLLALVPQMIGHTLLNNAMRHFSAHIVAFSILAEPVITAVLAVFLIHDRFSVVQLAGGVIVLAALGAVLVSEPDPARTRASVTARRTGRTLMMKRTSSGSGASRPPAAMAVMVGCRSAKFKCSPIIFLRAAETFSMWWVATATAMPLAVGCRWKTFGFAINGAASEVNRTIIKAYTTTILRVEIFMNRFLLLWVDWMRTLYRLPARYGGAGAG